MIVTFENKNYQVEDNEFTKLHIVEYCNLQLYNELGELERIVALINDCCSLSNNSHLVIFNPSHGGYIPINSTKANKITLFGCHPKQEQNILKNISEHTNKNIIINNNFDGNYNNEELLFLYNDKNAVIDLIKIRNMNREKKLFILTNQLTQILKTGMYSTYYRLSNTNMVLFIPDLYKDIFEKEFSYFIQDKELAYDNLINLCIMVKNAGPQFETMLKENMGLIDEWTILDTGSSDETIDIIKKTLIGIKKGNLYQEPFINFRDSRNRCLDLAGTRCKYTIMLDDTYIVKGDIRKFLNTIRSDQFADSYSMYIQSDDVEYSSNRILKTNRLLRYKFRIHEVITDVNNKNVITPMNDAYIFDGRFDYMEKRTMDRKSLDLQLLQEEIDEDPDNPRSYYYMAQTYNLLHKHQLAYDYFLQRANHRVQGFIQEKIDAIFEAARIANFQLNRPWDECEKLYNRAYELDKTRPDSLYFIGIHYYLENDMKNALKYFKRGFELGYPIHAQYSLKPTLSFYFLPKFLTEVCYYQKEYVLGEKASRFFLEKNKPDVEQYEVVMSWYKIYNQINKIPEKPSNKFYNFTKFSTNKPFLCFHADGGFNNWSGSSIIKNGVGGSETYIIEMARHIQRQGYYQVFVFCKCEQSETFEDVEYLPLEDYYEFISHYEVEHVIISRFSEYYPATLLCKVKNIYFVVHDLSLSGIVIPIHEKLKKVFCLTEWHVDYFNQIFPSLKHLTCPLYYGVNPIFKQRMEKIPYSFIYSSFPGRGLLELLKMWPKIYDKYPQATLHIYSDVSNKWSNSVEPKKMQDIRDLLETYDVSNNGYNIFYHGWVDKKTLADAWSTAEYWLYPCTFMETFCLTALEAAITKTFAITNDLAALQNTLGDRGLVIKGDASTEEWQINALDQLFKIMEEPDRKQMLIQRNYEWASQLSWENQAHKLVLMHLSSSTTSITTQSINSLPIEQTQEFAHIIHHINQNYNKSIYKILDIGTSNGSFLIKILSLIPHSIGYGIDTWDDSNDIDTFIENYENKEKIFQQNIKREKLNNRIRAIKGDTCNILLDFIYENLEFDFIYINNTQKSLDAYNNIILSWKLLSTGGILIINTQYLNNINPNYDVITCFLNKYKTTYKILHNTRFIFLQKI
jgi:hypothetical protein